MANQVSTQSNATYLDIVEVADWLQLPAPPSGADAVKLQRVIDMACQWASNYCNRPIAPTLFNERHDGWSGDTIMLRRTPFVSLVSATEWQSSGGPVQLLEATPENGLDGINIDYATSKITYLAGWNPIPPDVWLGTCELVAHWWRNTQQASRSGFSKAGEYDPAPTSQGDGLWQGVPYRIIAIFDPYRKVSIG